MSPFSCECYQLIASTDTFVVISGAFHCLRAFLPNYFRIHGTTNRFIAIITYNLRLHFFISGHCNPPNGISIENRSKRNGTSTDCQTEAVVAVSSDDLTAVSIGLHVKSSGNNGVLTFRASRRALLLCAASNDVYAQFLPIMFPVCSFTGTANLVQ